MQLCPHFFDNETLIFLNIIARPLLNLSIAINIIEYLC